MSFTRVDSLISWARHHGAHFHEQVEVYDDPQHGISLGVRSSQQSSHLASQLDHSPPERQNLPPKSRVVSCPFSLSLSFLNALSKFPELQGHSARFPALFLEVLEPHIIGHFFLVQQYLNADTSHWGPYIKSLPQPEESERLGTPLYFAEADVAWIRGTDLEIAREQRQKTWKSDWERGRHILDTSSGWEKWQGKWTWDLYKWAATIFSSRSFISTLIPEEIVTMPVTHGTRSFDGIFPVLFPLLDLANHSSAAKVTWFTNVRSEPKDLSIIAESEIPYGQQVFNNYAPKNNTELMLGYGFCIPGNDDVSIAFKPLSKELRVIKQLHAASQGLHGPPVEQSVFHVRATPYAHPASDRRPPEFTLFEDGCVEALSLMVANRRELDNMIKYPSYYLERSSYPLSRNALSVMSALLEKLQMTLDKITLAGTNLGVPATSCQQAAKIYRDGQISVLQAASSPLQCRLEVAMSQHTICRHSRIVPAHDSVFEDMRGNLELVTLKCAFSWLQDTNRELYDHSIKIIARELETTTVPDLDWMELIATGWDYTIWCLWIYIALLLHVSSGKGSDESHVMGWVDDILETYDPNKTFSGESFQIFRGDRDEGETLKVMTDQISPMLLPNIPYVDSMGDIDDVDRRILNFASMIAMEEIFTVGVNVYNDKGKERIHQRILYMSKNPNMYSR